MIENGLGSRIFGSGRGRFGNGEHDGGGFFEGGTSRITFLLKEENLILHILNINLLFIFIAKLSITLSYLFDLTI